MNNFELYNPTKIIFGKNEVSKLDELIEQNKKVLLTYGGGSIFKNGVYNQVKEALRQRQVVEFGGIEPNPTYETSMKAIDIIRKENIDFILAVGGGSVIDASKFIAAAVFYDGNDPWEILAANDEVKKAVPLGTILTLPATGTEMNANSVISRVSTQEKLAFSSVHVYPVFSILDPSFGATLPKKQVANGIIDAFTHVIEQYLTHPLNTPLQDRLAESILITLIEEGPKAYSNPADYDAMANLFWCSTMALNGIISRGVQEDWAIHTIGHELTALYNIDHAQTLAIVMPGLWKVFKEEKKQKLLQYASRVWKIEGSTADEIIEKAVFLTSEFFESLGINTRLSEYNLKEDTVDIVADRLERRRVLRFGDRFMVTPEKVREILKMQL